MEHVTPNKIDCNLIYSSPAFMVRAPLNIMFQPNQMAIYRYERIPFSIRVHRIRVASIRIVRIYLKANASTVNPIKMLLWAMKPCTYQIFFPEERKNFICHYVFVCAGMILFHVTTTAARVNRIYRIFAITTNCIAFTWKGIQCCRHLNQLVKRSW